MDIDEIAEGLSEPQREDILKAEATYEGDWTVWSSDLRTAKALERKGLTQRLRYTGGSELTPLGQQVRAHLENSK